MNVAVHLKRRSPSDIQLVYPTEHGLARR